jgi:hypothetical protein
VEAIAMGQAKRRREAGSYPVPTSSNWSTLKTEDPKNPLLAGLIAQGGVIVQRPFKPGDKAAPKAASKSIKRTWAGDDYRLSIPQRRARQRPR